MARKKKQYIPKDEIPNLIIDEVMWFIEDLEKKHNAEIRYNIDKIFVYEKKAKK